MMEDFADAAPSAFGNFTRPLDRTNPDILARLARTLADILRRADGVQRDQITRTFADALGRLPGAFGGALADVPSTAAYIASGAAALRLRGRLRSGWRLRNFRRWCGLRLA